MTPMFNVFSTITGANKEVFAQAAHVKTSSYSGDSDIDITVITDGSVAQQETIQDLTNDHAIITFIELQQGEQKEALLVNGEPADLYAPQGTPVVIHEFQR
jgi:hypothetical protein